MAGQGTASAAERGTPWWRRGVVYQIYPRSFQDSNGDGIGDLRGVIDRLDYLNDGTERSLGVDALWLSPTFPSPMKDFGYDVSDFCGVHPDFGTLETMDELIAGCHRRGIRLLLDYVPNHTSDQHPWFIESHRSRADPRRDWYYWRDPAPGGGPPNNWISVFGGGAWTRDAAGGQYYLHSYLAEQPDLNWRNPAVVQAMHDALRFWLRRGVDGFRVDALGMALKDPQLRDNPPNPDWDPAAGLPARASQLWRYNRDWPEAFDLVRGLRAVADEFPERMLVGEVFGPPEQLGRYYGGATLDGLHLAFNFGLISGYGRAPTAWDAASFRRIVDEAEAKLPPGAWPSYALGNHDVSRPVTRYGRACNRAVAVLLLTLRGTPFIYYGDEIGMEDVTIPEDRAQDPARFHAVGRDPERTPMQWRNGPGAGFTSGEPWLPLGDLAINVSAQDADSDSLLSLYRRLIWLRRRTPALHSGSYRAVAAPRGVFAFVRAAGPSRVFVAINFESAALTLPLPEGRAAGTMLCASTPGRDGERISALQLGPREGCVVQL